MEDDKSKWEKLKEGIGEATDTFSGKKTEDLVNEYTDLYTKVILGLHQDVYSGPHCQDHFSRKIRQRLSSPVMDFRWCLIGQRLVWSLVGIIVEIGVESLGQLRYGLV